MRLPSANKCAGGGCRGGVGPSANKCAGGGCRGGAGRRCGGGLDGEVSFRFFGGDRFKPFCSIDWDGMAFGRIGLSIGFSTLDCSLGLFSIPVFDVINSSCGSDWDCEAPNGILLSSGLFRMNALATGSSSSGGDTTATGSSCLGWGSTATGASGSEWECFCFGLVKATSSSSSVSDWDSLASICSATCSATCSASSASICLASFCVARRSRSARPRRRRRC